MEKINRATRTLFWFALVCSILFVVGIPMIVFGATNSMTVCMVVGIVFTGADFYAVPLLWVAYGGKRELSTLVYAVVNLGLHDVPSLASHLRCSESKVRLQIDNCLTRGYLQGFIRSGDKLVLANIKPQVNPDEVLHDVVCPCCNAKFTYRGTHGVCPYCGVGYGSQNS